MSHIPPYHLQNLSGTHTNTHKRDIVPQTPFFDYFEGHPTMYTRIWCCFQPSRALPTPFPSSSMHLQRMWPAPTARNTISCIGQARSTHHEKWQTTGNTPINYKNETRSHYTEMTPLWDIRFKQWHNIAKYVPYTTLPPPKPIRNTY